MDTELRTLIAGVIQRTVENVGRAADAKIGSAQALMLTKFTEQLTADIASIGKAIIGLLANMKPKRTKYTKEKKWLY